MEIKIDIPKGIEVNLEKNSVSVKGKHGELNRNFDQKIKIKKEEDKIILLSKTERKGQRALMGTIRAHIKNMFHGVSDKIVYKSKIVYSHFPMTVNVQGDNVIVDNFLGERHPRKAKILEKVDVKISGQEITITGIDKEKVSQTTANLEQATKIKRRDPRVFQDGIYITEKDGKPIH